LQVNASFWKLIEKRRKQKTVPLEEIRKRVNISDEKIEKNR